MTQSPDPRIAELRKRHAACSDMSDVDLVVEDLLSLATSLASELSQERHIYADMNTQRHEVLDECDRLRAELSAAKERVSCADGKEARIILQRLQEAREALPVFQEPEWANRATLDGIEETQRRLSACQAELEQARRAHLDEVALANTALAKCGHCYKCGGSGEAAEFDGRPVTCSECHGAGNTRGGQMLSSERARREGLELELAELRAAVSERAEAIDEALELYRASGAISRDNGFLFKDIASGLRGAVSAPPSTAAVVASSATGEGVERCEQCPGCAKQPHEVNHPPGMVFVGWGTGWQPCPRCNGSGKNPPRPAEDPSDEELRELDWKAHEAARDAAFRSSPGGIDYDIVWRAVRRAIFNAGREFERKERR